MDGGLTTELTLMLDAAAIDPGTGKFLQFAQEDPSTSNLPTDPTPLTPVDRAEQLINGRELNDSVLLVNGRELPTVVLDEGVPQRWRIVNVANGRFMRISIPEEWRPYRIGGDGGLLEEALPVQPIGMVPNPDAGQPGQPDEMPDPESVVLAAGSDGRGTVIAEIGVLLSPGERADVVFTPQRIDGGNEVILDWYDFPRGRHAPAVVDAFGNIGLPDDDLDGKRPRRPLLRVELVGGFDDDKWQPPSPLPRSLPIDDIRSDPSDGPLSVAFGHTPPAPSTFLPDLLRGRIMFFGSLTKQDDLIDRAQEAIADIEATGETDIDKVGPTAVKFPVATETGITVNTVMVGGGGGRPAPFGTVAPFLAAPGMVTLMEEDGVGEAVALNSDTMGLIVDRVGLKASIGETRIWEVVNLTAGEHPFHPHGFFFQPIEAILVDLAANGGKGQIVKKIRYPLENKDVIRLPGRPAGQFTSFSLVRGVVRFDDSARQEAGRADLVRSDEEMLAEGILPGGDGTVGPSPGDSGTWVTHCHILEHADTGMFSFLELGPRDQPLLTPTLPPDSVVNGASFRAATDPNGAIAPGSIVSLFGTDFAADTQLAASVPLPTTLGDTSVTFNDIAVPLFVVSGRQINAQVPFDVLPGEVAVQIKRGSETSTVQTVTVAAVSPGIFAVNQQGTGQGAVLIANAAIFAAPSGSIPGREGRPASRGEFISIFASGLGDVTNRPPSGAPPSGNGLSVTMATPTVTIGGVTVPPSFSGLTSSVGLYQVNAQVPSNALTGEAVEVMLTIGGVASNTVTIAVE